MNTNANTNTKGTDDTNRKANRTISGHTGRIGLRRPGLPELRLALGLLLRRLSCPQPDPLDAVHYIGGSDALPPPLSPEEEREAISELERGNVEARQKLIEHNLRLVVYLARRFENTGVGLEDLISIGTIGLIKGVTTFRKDKNIKLATYASRCVENEILMHLRKVTARKGEVSIDEPLNTDWDGNELLLGDILGTDGDEISQAMEDDVERQMLLEAVNALEERERTIIILRFGLLGHPELTQKEVADRMGISQSYISRLEKRIILRLRREMSRMMQGV